MKDARSQARSIVILQALMERSDENHKLSIADLIDSLNEAGIEGQRRAVYDAIDVLRARGYKIFFSRANGKQGYWLAHDFTLAEAFVISDAVAGSPSLSKEDTDKILSALKKQISIYEQTVLEQNIIYSQKAQQSTLDIIQTLMSAMAEHHPVTFRYYDLTLKRQKKYRRNARTYCQVPYALVTNQGRTYCVFYSREHHGFANYRLDRMDAVEVMEEKAEGVPFHLNDWMQSSFQMYAGEAVTAVIEFDLSLTSVVLDQFGQDMIIVQADDHTFTAGIRTALTPTLTAWLLQFYDRIRVKKPQALIDSLLKIADSIQNTYNEEKERGASNL